MKKILLLIFLITSNFIFSQEAAISTKFIQAGGLHKSENITSVVLVRFKENQKCVVMSYLGKEIYKITYKEWVGYVNSDDLDITEEVMDLYFDFEDQKRIKALAKERKRQQDVLDIENRKANADQAIIDKVKAEEKRQLALQELARKKEAELQEKIRQDAIAKVKAEEQRQLALQELARKKEAELQEKARQGAIAKEKAEEKRQLALQELARKKEAELQEKVRQDAIAKVKAEEQRQLELQELARKKEAELQEKIRQDAIAKVKAEEKRQLELREIIRKKEVNLKQKRTQDSIINAKDEEERRLRVLEQIRKKEAELEAKRIQNTNNDERTKFRNTCHYLLNEYDDYYKETTIRTEPYRLSKVLTVELHRQGRVLNIFFNLSEDLGCASYLPNNRSTVKVTLENNQVITFYHSWNMDCGDFSFKGKLSKAQILKLEQSPIKSIKLKGTKYSSEITNLDYKEFFIDKLSCLD
ncbi:MAG: cell envelope integrity protein TolA [Algibacter sp.]